MKLDFRDELWGYGIAALVLAGMAAGFAFWLTSGGAGGLNIP